MLIAEAVIQLREARGDAPSRAFRRAAYVSSALANNLPDFDFLYSRITEPPKLGYLVHHRGHTHTIVAGIALSLVMLLAWRVFARRSRRALSASEWRWLVALVLLGPLLHIGMDFTNNYGVHPFWPFFDGWFYGDFVFIVEPLFFAIGVPPLLAAMRATVARWIFGGVLAAIVGLAWAIPWVPIGVAVLVTTVSALSVWLSKRLSPARRIAFAFVSALVVAFVFSAARVRAEALVRASLPEDARLEDIALTPAPANPFCFSTWRLSTRASMYVAERGVVATFPGVLPVSRCRTETLRDDPTAPLELFQRHEGSTLRWTGRFVAPSSELSALNAKNCFAAAFLRFARLPYWKKTEAGSVLGDLRYDRTPDIEFAEMDLPEAGACPRFVPSWTPPRREMLD